jgi:thiol-disulfide isomerase/thioredoxin
MPSSLQLGPLVLPVAFVIALAAFALGSGVGHIMGRRQGVDISGHLWRIAVLSIVAARLAFVWRYRSAYFEAPWDIFNIRDGGWDAQLGVVAAWAYTLALVQKHVHLRRALLASVGAASALWLGTSLALLALPGEPARLVAHPLKGLGQPDTTLASFQGKPVVVNLWATWCPPCRREMPVLQRAQAEHADIHYVFVNQGETPEQIQAFMFEHGVRLRHVLIDAKGLVAAAYQANGYPTTLFFNAQGQLVSQRMGELSWATLNEQVQGIRQLTQP